MATETSQATEATPDPYFELVKTFPLRRIRTDAEPVRAIEFLDSLDDRRRTRTPDESEYFFVLAMLVERYESEIYPDTGPYDL